MELLRGYWKQRGFLLLLLGGWAVVFAVVFALYDLPGEAVGYAVLLGSAGTALMAGVDFLLWRRRRRALKALASHVTLGLEDLPEPWGSIEAAYQELLEILYRDRQTLVSQGDERRREMVEYYTLWAHQIKTPIAAMRLLLQGDDTERGRELSAELFKIEQYVEMVLQYLRLGSDTTDYLIREVPLEQIVRQAVRKYAQLFIHSRVSLDLQPLSLRVLTDEKWLGFVVEQVLSNAVKYARGGTVRIFAQGDTLVIQDNGIGIAPEDLPRVFENGYTGCNGRTDKRSTGIGLYLCRQICDRLGHRISLSSRVGKGTEVRIELGRSALEVE